MSATDMSVPITRSAPGTAVKASEWLFRGRVPCLDGLRGIAILLVLVCHVIKSQGFRAPAALQPFLQQGGPVRQGGVIGVDIFFCLSGFLITLLLLRELQRTKSISIKAFYRRRALRILPAYFAFLGVVFGLTCLGLIHLESRHWRGLLTYTVNLGAESPWVGHVWSLSIEEQFYLMWPLLLFLIKPQRAKWVALAYLGVIGPALRAIGWVLFPDALDLALKSQFHRGDNIAAGCLLALLAMDPVFRERTRCSGWKAFSVGTLALGVVAVCCVVRHNNAIAGVLSDSARAISLATILWLCINHQQSPLGWLLHSRLLVTLGALSYSLYLWQQLFLSEANMSWTGQWPVNILLTGLTAAASYLFVESPFLRLKDRTAALPHAPRETDGPGRVVRVQEKLELATVPSSRQDPELDGAMINR